MYSLEMNHLHIYSVILSLLSLHATYGNSNSTTWLRYVYDSENVAVKATARLSLNIKNGLHTLFYTFHSHWKMCLFYSEDRITNIGKYNDIEIYKEESLYYMLCVFHQFHWRVSYLGPPYKSFENIFPYQKRFDKINFHFRLLERFHVNMTFTMFDIPPALEHCPESYIEIVPKKGAVNETWRHGRFCGRRRPWSVLIESHQGIIQWRRYSPLPDTSVYTFRFLYQVIDRMQKHSYRNEYYSRLNIDLPYRVGSHSHSTKPHQWMQWRRWHVQGTHHIQLITDYRKGFV